ncbi:MAG: hypothetical protein WCR71_04275 [Bacteroidales bacterium]
MEETSNIPKSKVSVSPKHQAKKRAVVSYANLKPDLLAAFKEKYPRGYSDYMSEVFKVEKPDGSFFYAVSLELPDSIYLVKVDVKIDDYEDLQRGLYGEEPDDDDEDSDEFPDDDPSASFIDDQVEDD